MMENDNPAFCIAGISAMSIAAFMVTMTVHGMQLLNMNHLFYLGAIITIWLLIIVAIIIVIVFSYRKYRDDKVIMK